MSNYRIVYSDHLAHHGILGQKWGKRNGPPYPLGASDHSSSEKKAGWKNSLDKKNRAKKSNKKKFKLTDKQKKYIKIGLAVAGTAAIVGVSVYLIKSGKGKTLVEAGKKAFGFSNKGADSIISSPIRHKLEPARGFADLASRIKNGIVDDPESMFRPEFWKSLTHSEVGAVKYYTSNAYKTINTILRDGEEATLASNGFLSQKDIDKAKVATKKVTEVLSKSVLDKEVITYRMTDSIGAKHMFPDLYSGKISSEELIGKTFKEKAFYSSGLIPQSNFGSVKLTTICPKGTQALYVGKKSVYPWEKELLLQRGTDFKVLDVIKDVNGNPIEFVLEVVDQLA